MVKWVCKFCVSGKGARSQGRIASGRAGFRGGAALSGAAIAGILVPPTSMTRPEDDEKLRSREAALRGEELAVEELPGDGAAARGARVGTGACPAWLRSSLVWGVTWRGNA
jgi:hypothetical protein